MTGRVWLTIPTYDEAGNVERIVRAAVAELERVAPGDFRVLVVDDASPDGTGAIADRLAAELGTVEVLHRRGKEGLGQAYRAGFAHAVAGGAELVLVMDADFSHDPAHLPALIAAAEEADLVLGSRYVPGGRIVDWPPLRRLLSRWGGVYARRVLGVQIRDLTGGYRCIRREVLETINSGTLRSQGYVFNIEFAYRAVLAGFRVKEVPITFADRRVGQSKMAFRIALEALWLLPRLPERARRLGPRVGVARRDSRERPAAPAAQSASSEST